MMATCKNGVCTWSTVIQLALLVTDDDAPFCGVCVRECGTCVLKGGVDGRGWVGVPFDP